nr:zinc finger, CCHC-type [Tanacetum cinerariifolium]
ATSSSKSLALVARNLKSCGLFRLEFRKPFWRLPVSDEALAPLTPRIGLTGYFHCGFVVDLGIHGLGLVIVVIGKKLVVVLVGVVETVPASSTRIGLSSREMVDFVPESLPNNPLDYMMVVKEIEDVLVEEMEVSHCGKEFEQDIDGENEDDNENKLVMGTFSGESEIFRFFPFLCPVISASEYSRVIGCLMYAMTCTRPDIAFAVGKLNSNTEDNSSTSGWVFLLGGGAISWASKKQTYITGSTMEYEFVALAAAEGRSTCFTNHPKDVLGTCWDLFISVSEDGGMECTPRVSSLTEWYSSVVAGNIHQRIDGFSFVTL